MQLFGQSLDRKRAAIALVSGVVAFAGSFFSFSFSFPPHTISFTWSLFLPLLVSLAYGWRYALIAMLSGAGLFQFGLWPNNGWANLVNVAIYGSWYMVHGFSAQLRRARPAYWNNSYFVQFLCSLCYTSLLLAVFPRLFSFNPPFWYPAASSSIPQNIVVAIAIKQVIEMFSQVFICDLLLNTRTVPRMLGMPVLSSNRLTSKIVPAAALVGMAVVALYFTLEIAFFEQNTDRLIEQTATPVHIRTAVLILLLSMFAGMQLAKFMRRRIADEERLQESERRYHSLFEFAGDAIFLMQGDRFVECNTRTLELFGCSREQIIGATPVRFSPSEQPDGLASHEKAREKINAALAGAPQFFEWKHVKYDGTPFDAEVGLTRIELTSGAHLQAIVRDVSDRKRAEEEVRLSEEKLRLILENAPYAVYVLSLEGKGLYINRPAEIISGYSKEELLGRLFLDIVLPEDRASLLQRREARLAGRPTESAYVFRILDKTGMVHWVENQVIMLPWEGKPATLNFLQDITEKRKAEEDLLVKAQLLDSAGDSIFLLDQDGRIVYANETACRFHGYSRDELLSMNIREINDPDDASRVENQIGEVFDNAAVVFEAVHRGKNGTLLPIEVSARSLVLGDKRYILSITRDIAERKRVEAALKNSEEKFRKAFYTSPDAININRLVDGKYVSINRGFTQSMGYDESEIIGKSSLELNIWADPEDRKRLVEGLAANGEVRNLEARFLRKQGGMVYGLMSAAIISFEGEPHVLSVTRDITERRHTEEALRRSQQLLKSTFASLRDAFFLIDADATTIIDCNPAASEVFGYDIREMLGRTTGFLHVDDAAMAEFRHRLDSAIEAKGFLFLLEFEMKRKDGTVFPTEHSMMPIEEEGKVLAWVSVVRDITERKRVEEGMRDLMRRIVRSQKEWQDTFDSITDMISIHDTDYNVIKANKAFSASLGLAPGEVINRKCYDLLHHGASSPVTGCPHTRTMQNKVHVSQEVYDEITNKTYSVSTYPYFSPDGEFIGSIHISRDITEEKEQEMRMIMTERLASLGQMASGIAHEINNPLQSVMICSEMLLMKVVKDSYDHAQFEKYLKTIDEEVQRCRDITANMLSFSRQTTATRSDIDVHLLLDRAIDLVGYQGRLKNVKVTKKYGKQFLVSGNEGELRQVLLVLLINALDAMENKGAITVETGAEKCSAWVRISDTGPGIAPENIQKIFNPFFSTKTEKGGTGLGLSIAHRIMANHRGSLTAVSEQGHGAAFTITLPL
jgi:PAS domain S-box-containing protein